MLVNENNVKLTPNIQKISDCLTNLNLKHYVRESNTINLGVNQGDFFVDIMIMDNPKLGRICYYSKKKGLAFEEEMKDAVQDIISDINNSISYGHICLNSTGIGRCYALYRCFSSASNITNEEIKYNIRACNYMVHQYFDDFSHFGITVQ